MESLRRRDTTPAQAPSPLAVVATEGDRGTRLRRVVLAARLGVQWLVLVLIAAIAINVIGIHLAGSIDGWHRWMTDHRRFFLAWRLLLYTATAAGWIWMRRRLQQREGRDTTHRQLRRVEAAGVLLMLLLEVHLFIETR